MRPSSIGNLLIFGLLAQVSAAHADYPPKVTFTSERLDPANEAPSDTLCGFLGFSAEEALEQEKDKYKYFKNYISGLSETLKKNCIPGTTSSKILEVVLTSCRDQCSAGGKGIEEYVIPCNSACQSVYDSGAGMMFGYRSAKKAAGKECGQKLVQVKTRLDQSLSQNKVPENIAKLLREATELVNAPSSGTLAKPAQ